MNPVLFQLGPFQIRYYGILLALAFIVGYFLLVKIGKERKFSKEVMTDYFIWLALGILIGARLFHVLVYNPVYYLSNPLEILMFWKGGIASHGGGIGGILATWLFCRRRKIPFYKITDIVVIPVALGAVFVRIGNFINGELVGRITSLPWGMEFEGYEGVRHPSQLYSAFKNFVLFFILFNMRKIKLPQGVMFWSFIGIFSVFRFLVEFYKEFPLYYGLTIAQYLSIPLIILSGIMVWYLFRKKD